VTRPPPEEEEEEEARAYRFLVEALTYAARSGVPLYPVACPRCGSVKVTAALGAARLVECLSCGARYRLVEER